MNEQFLRADFKKGELLGAVDRGGLERSIMNILRDEYEKIERENRKLTTEKREAMKKEFTDRFVKEGEMPPLSVVQSLEKLEGMQPSSPEAPKTPFARALRDRVKELVDEEFGEGYFTIGYYTAVSTVLGKRRPIKTEANLIHKIDAYMKFSRKNKSDDRPIYLTIRMYFNGEEEESKINVSIVLPKDCNMEEGSIDFNDAINSASEKMFEELYDKLTKY